MSAPLLKSPYSPYIKWTRAAIADCERTILSIAPDHACYEALTVCSTQLRRALRLMETGSIFTTRYLVDCAETCAYCARRCEEFPDCKFCTHARNICREGVGVLRRGSFV